MVSIDPGSQLNLHSFKIDNFYLLEEFILLNLKMNLVFRNSRAMKIAIKIDKYITLEAIIPNTPMSMLWFSSLQCHWTSGGSFDVDRDTIDVDRN